MKQFCQNIKIIFIGTPEFGAIILEEMIRNKYKPVLVVTAPDKPVGRKQIITPPPVKIMAQRYGISVSQPEKLSIIINQLSLLKPDLIVVAAFSQILSKKILDIPKYGCINVHPSLLPKYRGPSPIQYAILNGDKETGTTIILMDEKMDSGPILTQRKTEIKIKETALEFHGRLAHLGSELLIETLPQWIEGKIKIKPQDEARASYTKILKKEDGKIDWQKSAEEIERQIRAFAPWPSTFTSYKGKKLKILKVSVLEKAETASSALAGKTFLSSENKTAVHCGKGDLVIEELQLEGKRKMTSEEFLRGHQDFIKTILG